MGSGSISIPCENKGVRWVRLPQCSGRAAMPCQHAVPTRPSLPYFYSNHSRPATNAVELEKLGADQGQEYTTAVRRAALNLKHPHKTKQNKTNYRAQSQNKTKQNAVPRAKKTPTNVEIKTLRTGEARKLSSGSGGAWHAGPDAALHRS